MASGPTRTATTAHSACSSSGSTGLPLDAAAQALLFDPVGSTGAHLTTDGQLPSDIGYRLGVERLSRLGGAGNFIVSTDDLTTVLAELTDSDLDVLRWPGVIVDQYGWGHTGSVQGAVACAWVLEGGRTDRGRHGGGLVTDDRGRRLQHGGPSGRRRPRVRSGSTGPIPAVRV